MCIMLTFKLKRDDQPTATFAGSQGGDEDRRAMPVVISPGIPAVQPDLLDVLCVHQGQRCGSVESGRAFGRMTQYPHNFLLFTPCLTCGRYVIDYLYRCSVIIPPLFPGRLLVHISMHYCSPLVVVSCGCLYSCLSMVNHPQCRNK